MAQKLAPAEKIAQIYLQHLQLFASLLGREGETEEMRALSSLLTSYEGTLSTTQVQSLILRYRKPGYDLHPGYKGKVKEGTLKFGFPHKSDHITIFHHSKLDYI